MGYGGDGFSPSQAEVDSSTKTGGNLDQTHQFTGSVFITSSATSLSASNALSASSFWTPSGQLTAGGAPGGSDTQIQFNSGSIFSGSSNLAYNYDANTLSFTGTLLLSSSDGIPLRVSEDEDATIIVGEAALGNGGNTGVAYACHKDHTGASSAGFQQKLLGEVRLNAVNTKAIIFAANGSEKASFNQQAVANLGYIGWGPFGTVPAYPLDVGGSTRLGTDSTMTLYVTGAIDQSGSTVTFHGITSGSIAGAGSYVGVSTSGQLVLTASSGGGGGTPDGSDTQIQFNDGGSFGAEPNLTYDKTQSRFFVSGSTILSGSTTITGSAAIGTAPSYDGQGGDGIVLKVEGGGASTDGGNPVLVCQVTGTNSGDAGYVGIGTAQPKVNLDIRWSPNLDPNTAGGDVVSFATGTTTAGALYYLNDGGGWVSASAATTGSGNNQMLGIALGTNAQNDGMLIRGWADVTNFYQDTFKPGQAVYIASASSAANEGKMSGSAPTAADSYVRIVGYASPDSTTIYFNPGTNWVELS